MVDTQFPSQWISCSLGEVLELKYGKSLPAKSRDGGEYPVYGSNGVVGGHSEPLVHSSGIVVGRKGSFGEVQLSKTAFFPIDTTYYVDDFYSQPVDYWFNQLRFLPLNQLNRSTAIPGLNRDDAYNQIIALPPLAEQKAIAQKLATLLAQVEATKARLDRIPDMLKRFRQSVLAAAVSGKLTEEWRGKSASVSYEEYEEWKWPPVPADWNVKLYPNVVDSRLGKMLDKTKNTGVPTKYIGNINVRWFHFDLVKMQEILISESEKEELSLRAGDVLICEGGEPGRCAVWNVKSDSPIVFQKALHRARVKNEILPFWLAINLKNDANNLTLNQLFTGTTIKHLTGKALKKYPLRIPAIEEQSQIVEQVESLFAHADSIGEQVRLAQERVNTLTQSILAKAFRGDLTAEWRAVNSELISGDHSAEALLAKIRLERVTLKKQLKPKGEMSKKKKGKKMSDHIIKVVEALKLAGEPLSGQQLLAAAGYAGDSSTEQLEHYFLDIRDALLLEKSIVRIKRDENGEDWFSLAEAISR